jgi:hypothetical protein
MIEILSFGQIGPEIEKHFDLRKKISVEFLQNR